MPGLADAFGSIGDAAEHVLPQTHAAGLALAVTDGEETLGVVVRGFADVAAQTPVRPETRFEIGSISKQFAAICVLQEVEAGRLDLHVSVNDLVPWLRIAEPLGPITLHHLLTHTSGLPIGTEESPTGPGALAILRTLVPTFRPGERFHYSNDGYKVAGAVLEHVTGSPMDELLRERILGPLGMRHSDGAITNETRLHVATGYEPVFDDRPPHLNHPLAPARWIVSNTADGAIVSTVADMSAYARMLLGGGVTLVDGHEVRIVSRSMVDLLTTGHVETDERSMRYGYGIDVWETDGRRMIGHSGGMVGYTALLRLDLDAGLGCVTMYNGGGDKVALTDHALAAVRASIAGAPVAAMPHPSAPTAIEAARADELAGRYVGVRPIELQRTSDGLRLVDGAVGVAVERWPDDDEEAFLVPHPALDRFLLRVLRDGAGSVSELVHGPDRFAPEGRTLDGAPAHEPAWESCVGFYRSNDPWSPTMRVFLRAGRLWLLWPAEGIEQPLDPLDDGSFAVGERWVPRRVSFDEVVDGRATVARFNGGNWYRSFED
ncbi:MAG TPA: serine hydrolase domain-containing protein [Actinomycetota bacterium]|nr:serine hydrolase domain-containing protein [Actinomycetota bacterium]